MKAGGSRKRRTRRSEVVLETTRRTFEERTRSTLGPQASGEDGWIWQGALEQSQTTDHLIVFTDIYLGMHGMAAQPFHEVITNLTPF